MSRSTIGTPSVKGGGNPPALTLWGRAQGPIAALAPQTRLICGALCFAACLAVHPERAGEGALLLLTVGSWVALCGLPWAILRPLLVFGLALFVPYFLLTPWIEVPVEAAAGGLGRLTVPWRLFARGMAGMTVSVATAATLTITALHDGLRRLHLPGTVTILVIQIVHQGAMLVAETQRIAAAMAVRGAVGRKGAAWQVIHFLPRAWLPRIAYRADRVAAAMEVRGYGSDLPCFRDARLGRGDWIAIILAAAWSGLLVMVSMKGGAR